MIIIVPYKVFDKVFISAEVCIAKLAEVGLDAGVTYDDETHTAIIEVSLSKKQ